VRINRALAQSWQDVVAAGWQILHAAGERNDIADPGDPAYRIVPYIDRMDLAFAVADMIVSRSGAATVSEISALGIPAVYVPYAVGNGEQALNASAAVSAGAAVLIPDGELTGDRIRSTVVPLLTDPTARQRMRDGASTVGTRSGSENVLGLIDRALGR